MKYSVRIFLAAIVSCGCFVSSAAAEEEKTGVTVDSRARMSDERSQPLLEESARVYRALLKGPHGSVPQSVLNEADCVVVLPGALTAAVVLGGTHGDGTASCKLADGTWSSPAFFDINEASIGAQVGAKNTDIVMFFTSGPAVAALKKGKFEFGADASVVAGTFDRSVDTERAGVIAYHRRSGAFVGASFSGGSLASDEESNRRFYGRTVTSSDLLEGKDIGAARPKDSFTALLP